MPFKIFTFVHMLHNGIYCWSYGLGCLWDRLEILRDQFNDSLEPGNLYILLHILIVLWDKLYIYGINYLSYEIGRMSLYRCNDPVDRLHVLWDRLGYAVCPMG